jgi:uncharacterized membrane protein
MILARHRRFELLTYGSGVPRNMPFSPSETALMENSWKLVEHIRDRRQEPAWEAAQALAKNVLETRAVGLAVTILRGGPFALRRALELAEQVIEDAAARSTTIRSAKGT